MPDVLLMLIQGNDVSAGFCQYYWLMCMIHLLQALCKSISHLYPSLVSAVCQRDTHAGPHCPECDRHRQIKQFNCHGGRVGHRLFLAEWRHSCAAHDQQKWLARACRADLPSELQLEEATLLPGRLLMQLGAERDFHSNLLVFSRFRSRSERACCISSCIQLPPHCVSPAGERCNERFKMLVIMARQEC